VFKDHRNDIKILNTFGVTVDFGFDLSTYESKAIVPLGILTRNLDLYASALKLTVPIHGTISEL